MPEVTHDTIATNAETLARLGITQTLPEAPLDGQTPAQMRLAHAPPGLTEPPIRPDLEAQYDRLIALVEHVLGPADPDDAGRWAQLLAEISDDQTYEGVEYLGLIRAPASAQTSRAREGGLVAHMLDSWRAWTTLRDGFVYPNSRGAADHSSEEGADQSVSELICPPYLTDAAVLRHILARDIHRGWATFVLDPSEGARGEWRVVYGEHPTRKILNPFAQTLHLLGQVGIALDESQLNALSVAHDDNAPHDTVLAYMGNVIAQVSVTLDRLRGRRFLLDDQAVSDRYMVPGDTPAEPEPELVLVLANADQEAPLYLARFVGGGVDWHAERVRAMPVPRNIGETLTATLAPPVGRQLVVVPHLT